jgi:peptidoglycan/LPS O-acetylase OafA/YrhL
LVATQSARDEVVGRASGWGHVPALDGVRGVAVIAVLLFHGGVSWAKGGFLGVDAFFVLSGLLITSLLLDEAGRTGRIDLGHFWSRRARRLLPALFALVAAAGVYGAVLAPRGSLEGLRRDALATLFYVANWRFIQAGANYFEATAAPSVLRHTWSLAIEEQFYAVWPLVMFAIARVKGAARLGATAVVAGLGALASVVAMWLLFHPGQDTSRAYYGTDSRVQVVLTGALLAAVVAAVRRRPAGLSVIGGRVLGVAAGAATALFVAAVVTVQGTETRLFRGGFLLVAVAVAILLAHIVLVPAGWSSRALSWTPLRAIGIVSYGLYLWHWPVYLVLTKGRTGFEGPVLLGAKLAATAVLALASYYAVELPIRRGALPGMQAVVAATLATALAAAAVVVGTQLPPPRRVTGVAARTASGFPVSPRKLRPPGQPARVLVVGDSIALTLAQQLERPARRAGIAMTNKGVLGCGVVRGGPFRYFGKQQNIPPNCEAWPRLWADHIGRFDPDVVLAVVGRWEVMDRVHNGAWTHLGEAAFDQYVNDELERAVGVLTAGDAIVAFTTAPYFFRGERPDGGRWPEDDPARVDRFNAVLRAVVARHPSNTALLDLNARTSTGGKYTPVIDGISLRFDGVHFSPEGAAWLAPWFFGALLEMSPVVSASGGGTTTTAVPRPVAPVATAPPRAPNTTSPPVHATTTITEPPRTTTTTHTTQPPTTTSPLPTLPVG